MPSREIARQDEDVNIGDVRRGIDLSMYPSYRSPMAAHLPEDARERYNKTPTTIQNFRSNRSSHGYREIVEDHVGLVTEADGMGRLTHLPGYSLGIIFAEKKNAKDTGQPDPGLGYEDTFCGRIADFSVGVRVADMLGNKHKVSGEAKFSAHDAQYTKGSIWLRSEAMKAAQSGEYNPLFGPDGPTMSHFTGVFLRDSNTHYPISGEEYDDMSDWRLVSVTTSRDINPVDGIVDTVDRETGLPIFNMLSYLLKDERQDFRDSVGGNDKYFDKVLRDAINGWGLLYETVIDLAETGEPFDFEKDAWEPVLAHVGQTDQAAFESMKNHFANLGHDLSALEVPTRAARELQYLDDFEEHNPKISQASRQQIARRRANIKKEFIEGYTMAMQVKSFNDIPNNDPRQANPVRVKFSGHDTHSFNWAKAMGRAQKGKYREDAIALYAQYGQDKAKNLRFLMMTDDPKHTVFAHTKDMFSMEINEDFSSKPLAYSPGNGMDYVSQGETPISMIRSVYEEGREEIAMSGFVRRFIVTNRPGTQRMVSGAGVEGLVVDFNEAPAVFAQRAMRQMDVLGNDQSEMREYPTMGQILFDPLLLPPQGEVIITENKPNNTVDVLGTITNDEAFALVREGTKRSVRWDTREVVSAYNNFVDEQNAKPKPTRRSRKSGELALKDVRLALPSGDNKRIMQKRFVVRGNQLVPGDLVFGGLAMHNNVPYILNPPASKINEYQTVVMPNEDQTPLTSSQKAS